MSKDLDPASIKVNPLVRWSGSHCYLLSPTTLTWAQAQAYAMSLGGHLITINNAPEAAFLTAAYAHKEPWIGFTDQVVEGAWEWISAESVTYTAWAPSEPNTSSYDHAYLLSAGQWADSPATSLRYALIELLSPLDSDADGVPDVLDLLPAEPLNAFDLREAGGDALFDTADDVLYHPGLYTPYTTGTSLSLTLLDGPLGAGSYRLSVNSTLKDAVGNPLDGNSDGVGGDPYTHTSQVQIPADLIFEGRQNDTQAQATALTLSEDPLCAGLFISRAIGTIDAPQDQTDYDYFSFTAQAGDVVSVAVDTPESNLLPLPLPHELGRGLPHLRLLRRPGKRRLHKLLHHHHYRHLLPLRASLLLLLPGQLPAAPGCGAGPRAGVGRRLLKRHRLRCRRP